jgi:hypothetical protein
MDESITKKEIIENITSERTRLERLLEGISPEMMVEPGFEGDWSIKDILAHITEWEQLMVGWTQETLRGETPNRPAPGSTWDDLDQLNERLFQKNKSKGLDEVLTSFYDHYPKMYDLITSLSDEDLMKPDQFEWRNGDPLWHMVAANTWWHYKEHREGIEGWLASR